jgi:hypothetical protein
MILRKVRRGFFQKSFLCLKIPDAALQLPDALVLRHIGRQGLPCSLLPVRLNPEPECSIVNTECPRHLGNCPRQRGAYHFLYGLLLELRSVTFRLARHLIPSLSEENPIGFPVRKVWGTSDIAHGRHGAPGQMADRLDHVLRYDGTLAEVPPRDHERTGEHSAAPGQSSAGPQGLSLSLPYVPARLVIEVSDPVMIEGRGGVPETDSLKSVNGRLALVQDGPSSGQPGGR